MEHGGPAGGNGGKGGNIWAVADESLNSLIKFRGKVRTAWQCLTCPVRPAAILQYVHMPIECSRCCLPCCCCGGRSDVSACWPICNYHGCRSAQVHFTAKNGQPGQGSQRNGADGDDLYVSVPPGEPGFSANWRRATHICIEALALQHLPRQALTTMQRGQALAGTRLQQLVAPATGGAGQAPRCGGPAAPEGRAEKTGASTAHSSCSPAPQHLTPSPLPAAGTIIRKRDAEEDEAPLAELLQPGQVALLVAGGRGGRGNMSFKTQKNKAPALAERGEAGHETWLQLELKVCVACCCVWLCV